jgi:hypothetical protein
VESLLGVVQVEANVNFFSRNQARRKQVLGEPHNLCLTLRLFPLVERKGERRARSRRAEQPRRPRGWPNPCYPHGYPLKSKMLPATSRSRRHGVVVVVGDHGRSGRPARGAPAPRPPRPSGAPSYRCSCRGWVGPTLAFYKYNMCTRSAVRYRRAVPYRTRLPYAAVPYTAYGLLRT